MTGTTQSSVSLGFASLLSAFFCVADMGCGGSKVDEPLVTLCRERKELIKAASDHRYALAAAHVAYFQSLRNVGEAIRRFVDEELVVGSSSPPDSPVLTLPSDEFKLSSRKGKNKDTQSKFPSSSSTSISHSIDGSSNSKHSKQEKEESDGEDSHLHLSSGSASISGSESPSSSGHFHIEDNNSPEKVEQAEPYSYGYNYPYPPQENWDFSYSPGNTTPSMYYMKKSATPSQSFVYQEPEGNSASAYGYSGYSPYPNGGFFGYPMGSPRGNYGQRSSPAGPPPPPAPPSPPQVSAWDFLNVFESYDNGGYPGYYPNSRYGYGSTTSSPDSKEVREREGIPELEDETDPEMLKSVYKEKKKINEGNNNLNRNRNFGEGTSKAVPVQNDTNGEGSTPTSKYFSFDPNSNSKAVPSQNSESTESANVKVVNRSSPDTISSKSPEDEHAKKKAVSFEAQEASTTEIESSKPSSITTLSVHGTRDLGEVVKEIKYEFETASSSGKDVAFLLEVDKLPYQYKGSGFRVIFSRILFCVSPNASHSPARSSIRISSRTMKMAKEYCGGPGQELNTKPGNLSSTLDKLYAWEKKLYKEVKDEERLRVYYEKECKRLRSLDDRGAESRKIDAAQASIRKLLTKINVCIKAIEAISKRIHQLRDEELQPQLTELIHGSTKMWKSILRCHQKQFQVIMESKAQSLKANTGFQRESGLKATLELEAELLDWCSRFNNWINTQKAYVESLNEWLMRCLLREQEVTPDGVAPFSPSRVGAPPVFIICNDWCQAMDRVSETGVSNAMHNFASTLRQLWERQDEEQRQRTKAQYLSTDFEKRLRHLRMERERIEHERQEAVSDKTAVSKVSSESGVSPLDDLKVDLDLMRKKLEEERARHKEAIKLVHDAASSSLQAGLIPIFEALGSFSSEALKAHDLVRLQNAGGS